MTPRPGRAKWGDREGRRRDILAAARRQVESSSYHALNMRDLAADAGVSPGTLYSYFETKEALFATLYAEELERYADAIAPACARAESLEELLVDIIRPYLVCYERYGQYLNVWSLFQDPAALRASPQELRRSLADAAEHIGRQVDGAIARIADEAGSPIPDDRPVTSLIYAIITGLCDQQTTERRFLHRGSWDEMVEFAAAVVARGLTAEIPAAVQRTE